MNDEDRRLKRELYQIQQIRELNDEELQIEEVESLPDDSDDDDHHNGRAKGSMGEFKFNTCLASFHTYLGEVEDTHHRMTSVDSGTILTLPLFYPEGRLFCHASSANSGGNTSFEDNTMKFHIAIERALCHTDSLPTIGVVHVYRDYENRRLRAATVGTTAEIRQHRRLGDGSVNLVTRGKQRFRIRRQWVDVEEIPSGEVEVIEDDVPVRTPRDAFSSLPPVSSLNACSFLLSPKPHLQGKSHRDADEINDFDTESHCWRLRLHQFALESCCRFDMNDAPTSSDKEMYGGESEYLIS